MNFLVNRLDAAANQTRVPFAPGQPQVASSTQAGLSQNGVQAPQSNVQTPQATQDPSFLQDLSDKRLQDIKSKENEKNAEKERKKREREDSRNAIDNAAAFQESNPEQFNAIRSLGVHDVQESIQGATPEERLIIADVLESQGSGRAALTAKELRAQARQELSDKNNEALQKHLSTTGASAVGYMTEVANYVYENGTVLGEDGTPQGTVKQVVEENKDLLVQKAKEERILELSNDLSGKSVSDIYQGIESGAYTHQEATKALANYPEKLEQFSQYNSAQKTIENVNKMNTGADPSNNLDRSSNYVTTGVSSEQLPNLQRVLLDDPEIVAYTEKMTTQYEDLKGLYQAYAKEQRKIGGKLGLTATQRARHNRTLRGLQSEIDTLANFYNTTSGMLDARAGLIKEQHNIDYQLDTVARQKDLLQFQQGLSQQNTLFNNELQYANEQRSFDLTQSRLTEEEFNALPPVAQQIVAGAANLSNDIDYDAPLGQGNPNGHTVGDMGIITTGSDYKAGLDIDDTGAPTGAQSPISGKVTNIKTGYNGGFGLQVEVTGNDGTKVWLSHLHNTAVNVGDLVSAGQSVGLIGNSGNSSGGKRDVSDATHGAGNGTHLDVTMIRPDGSRYNPQDVRAAYAGIGSSSTTESFENNAAKAAKFVNELGISYALLSNQEVQQELINDAQAYIAENPKATSDDYKIKQYSEGLPDNIIELSKDIASIEGGKNLSSRVLENAQKYGTYSSTTKDQLFRSMLNLGGVGSQKEMAGVLVRQGYMALLNQELSIADDTGKVVGGLQNLKESLGAVGDEDLARMNTIIGNVTAAYIKEISGTAASDAEVQRLRDLLPSIQNGKPLNAKKIEAMLEILSVSEGVEISKRVNTTQWESYMTSYMNQSAGKLESAPDGWENIN